ncbi:hypothetical protein J437_LFUL006960 [Ladona fulva]|uniref:Uncharacterized protein n=1 Tax=Ladona fulva TaxID=123851 RepID=A0A8K0P564_LADFU|nr:hypothetical protein J437_LFUL006960 [Ladona fulva]
MHSDCRTEPNSIETGELCERIPSGHYESIGEVVIAVNKVLSSADLEEKIVMFLDTNRRVAIHSGTKTSLHVSNLLVLQLEFEPGIYLVRQCKSSVNPSYHCGIHLKYVYCDIVEQQLIGDVVSPLLRIVSYNASVSHFGQDVVHILSRPFYLPVMKREFETIEVDLRTHSGEPLPFIYGTSVIILHFRRSNAKSELDLFSLPPTQTSIESGQWVHYKPVSSLSDDAPLEFEVPGHGDEYVDLSHTLIGITACITWIKEEENAILYGPVNLWLHSLFSQIDVFLNQKLVTPPSHAYPYRAYIETLLNYGPAAKTSHLTSALWYGDTPGFMHDCINNAGAARRRVFAADGKEVELMGHLHCDLFNQEKFLPNSVEMRLKLVRPKSGFNAMAARQLENVRVRITDASLLVRKVKIIPSVLIAHSRALEKATAKFPLTRVDIKTVTISKDAQRKTFS